MILALLIALSIGLPLGLAAGGGRRGAPAGMSLDWLLRVGAVLPNFWLGMLLVVGFSALLRLLPSAMGANLPNGFSSFLLASLALALPLAMAVARALGDAVLEVRAAGFVRTARAKGMTRAEAVRRHGRRYMLLFVLGKLGTPLSLLVVGAVLVEKVFSLPGLGQLVLTGLGDHDYPLLRGTLLAFIAIAGIVILTTSVVGSIADPRLRNRGR